MPRPPPPRRAKATPRDPRLARAWIIKRLFRDRWVIIGGAGAHSADMAADHAGDEGGPTLAEYVIRRAWRALDREERKVRGNRYKIPRFAREEILSRPEFSRGVLAAAGSLSPETARRRAERYLREIAADHSPFVIDLIANAIRWLYTQGYGAIVYDSDQVKKVAALGQDHPLLFLPSHRSNLDRLSLQYLLWENDLPPNHTAGGINMNFFPVGPLVRRTGVFFIRRSFKDNLLYKHVLRSYIDYLIEKRFPLEWYLEGGRSRSGKLLPPRYGLLSYAVDSLRRGHCEDLMLIPTSIAYDQIQDLADYTREARGGGKDTESVRWAWRAIRSLRRRYGNIHVSFGEPVSVAGVLSRIEPGEEPSLGLQKVAFEVMYRIGQATPITPTAVVSIALLAARGKAKTAEQLAADCSLLVDYIEGRGFPVTESLPLDKPEAVELVLEGIDEHGHLSSHTALERTVYWLEPNQMIDLAYYRNVVVHFFVDRAIAETALAAMAGAESSSIESFRERALAIRDLLKFEFFFPEKEQFLERVETDLSIDLPDWRGGADSTAAAAELHEALTPKTAAWALLPFLDAYQVVADELAALGGAFNEKRFLSRALDRARMYLIEGELTTEESAHQSLLRTGLALAENRGLLDAGDGRESLAEEIRAIRSLIDR